jgi:hydrogenase maturation protein HypF
VSVAARHVLVEGIVQGVGFRPYVHGLAARHGLAGWVRNAGNGVEALIEGRSEQIEAFLAQLTVQPPPLARIAGVQSSPETPAGLRGFAIVASLNGTGTQPIPADVALCADCRRELHDPSDRRYRYPFINCTNCGPRYTIVEALPYDRERTSMRAFAMCAACRAEYTDPASRRFHAEPIACAACGPQLALVAGTRPLGGAQALAEAQALLAAGAIVAVKGLGGYHLACDARNAVAVERLSAWKARGDKPLAIMVRDRDELARVAVAGDAELALLAAPAAPVVLVAARSGSGLAAQVHPGTQTVGVMFPYTPLHELLLAEPAPASLIMTSANRASEPMIVEDAVALARLPDIAAAVLLHDRPIVARVDDGVSHVIDGLEAPLRRARGYAPLPVRLPFAVPPLLACGADMKNAFCFARDRIAVLSPHMGDLEDYDVFAAYETAVDRIGRLLRIDPEVVCYDAHPHYWGRRFAERRFAGRTHVLVQHHHAHVAAAMAEHELPGPVIGLAFDGTGYGDDGAIWGGEILVAQYAAFERVAHLAYVPLYGGGAAIREPWRVALAHARAAGVAWDERLLPLRSLDPAALRVVEALARADREPQTSSMGRLFDAVAALIGLRDVVTYDGQAAIELEAIADPVATTPYDFAVTGGTPYRIDVAPMIAAIVAGVAAGIPRPEIAGRFHATVVAIAGRACALARRDHGIGTVVLSGGVFQNKLLAGAVTAALESNGFTVYRHRTVPANDGGLALGQAVIGAARLRAGGVGPCV